jgi:hypothetical protein
MGPYERDELRLDLIEVLLTRSITEGTINPIFQLYQIRNKDIRYAAWQAILKHLVTHGQERRAHHLLKSWEKSPMKPSQGEKVEIRKLFGNILIEAGKMPSEDQVQSEARKVVNYLQHQVLEKGIALHLPGGKVYFLGIQIPGLLEFADTLPENFEIWKVQTKLLPDGGVSFSRKLSEEINSQLGPAAHFLSPNVTVRPEQALELGLIRKDGQGQWELVDPPPDLLTFRPEPEPVGEPGDGGGGSSPISSGGLSGTGLSWGNSSPGRARSWN